MLRLSDDGLSAVPMLVGEMLGEMPSSEMMLLKERLLLILIIIMPARERERVRL
jgi:hypothetical protein